MGFPRILKNLNLFNEGQSYLGEIATVTVPKLALEMQDWKGGGMFGKVQLDMGLDKLEQEFATGGPMRDVLRQFGVTNISGVFLRFAGAYQNDSTGEVDTVEITTRGRHSEIDMGEAKPGEPGEFKVKSALTYYRLDWNGVEEIEIDLLNMIFRVGGVDRLAEIRDAIS
jgi:P2 family phage contractile tail tube protein